MTGRSSGVSASPRSISSKVEKNHPGALASQWIPMDPALWRLDRYRDFLEARKTLLAEEANRRFADLLHGETGWISAPSPEIAEPDLAPLGGIASETEEAELEALNDWLENTAPSAWAIGLRPCRRGDRRAEGGVSTWHGRRGCSPV